MKAVLDTTESQVAAIRIDADTQTRGIVVRDNLLRGEKKDIRVDGSGRENVMLDRND